jgi:hypothetical protein
VCYGKTNIFGDVDTNQQRAFLVTRWAGASLLARKSNEHFVQTVWATNASEALL